VQFHALDDVDPVVVTVDDIGGYKSTLAAAGVEVVTLDVPATASGLPTAVASLSRLLAAEEVDLVHSHLPYSHVVGRLACARRSVPSVSTYHDPRPTKSLRQRVGERLTTPLCTRLVCVSEGVRQSYPQCDRAVVVYNAIDVLAFREGVRTVEPELLPTDHTPGDTVFLTVGGCQARKRQADLIEAMARLDDESVHLYVVGDGPLREELERLAVDLGVGDRVTLTGFVERVEPYYAAADAFVAASASEGLPTTHLEAMAAELPIVTTAISGITELIEHGVNGYLCPVGSPAALADRLRDVRGPDAADFTSTGLLLAQTEFSFPGVAHEHVALYRDLLAD
jgi:glycosyltransferase involved in cell wall biosynthesis